MNTSNNPLVKDSTKNFTNENDFLEKFGANALDKQRNLHNLIGENSWNIDMQKEEITFGDNLTFPMQVLGSYDHSAQDWLWLWENKAAGYPESIMQQALLLKKYGEENGIDLLKNGRFNASYNDIHLIGMIASEVFNSSCYYLGNYGQGTLVATIKSDAIDQLGSDDVIRISTVFPELISNFDVSNHKNALINYLTIKGYTINLNEENLEAEKNGKILHASFNERNLLTSLKNK